MFHRTGLPSRLALLTGLLLGGTAAAQTAAVLQPDAFRATAGQDLLLTWQTDGPLGLQPAAWPASVDWLFVRGLGTQENLASRQPAAADAGRMRVRLADPGATVIGLDQTPRILERAPAELAGFATKQLADGTAIVAQLDLPGEQPVRVRQFRSTKLIVRVAQPGAVQQVSSAAAQSKSGQRAEIRAFVDPTLVTPGSDFPFRTYLQGDKLPHVRVTAHNETTGSRRVLTTDAAGIGNLPIDAAGIWRLTWHRLRPARDAAADWNLHTATLRFEVLGGAE